MLFPRLAQGIAAMGSEIQNRGVTEIHPLGRTRLSCGESKSDSGGLSKRTFLFSLMLFSFRMQSICRDGMLRRFCSVVNTRILRHG